MYLCTQTVHHASGTVFQGQTVAADHPAVAAAPAVFVKLDDDQPTAKVSKRPR
jgi:hypothetical protein